MRKRKRNLKEEAEDSVETEVEDIKDTTEEPKEEELEKQRKLQEALYNEAIGYLRGLLDGLQSATKDTVYSWYGVYIVQNIAEILKSSLTIEQIMILKNNRATIKHPMIVKQDFLLESLNSVAPIIFSMANMDLIKEPKDD